MRTVKQSSVVRETENGEEGEDEAVEFGEGGSFHQQVEAPGTATHAHTSQALFMQLPCLPACSLCGSLVPT